MGVLREKRGSTLGFGKDLGGLGLHLVNVAHQIESRFRQVIELTGKDHIEALDGVFQLHIFALLAGEDLSDKEGLGEELLNLAGPIYGATVVLREFV